MRDVGHEGRRAPGHDESDGVGMAVQRTAINPVAWSQELGFNQAVLVSGHTRTLFCSGQTAMSPDGRPQHEGDLSAQLALSLDNLEAVLAEARMTLADVVRLNVYTTDVDALNDLFASGVVTVFGDVMVLAGIMIAMLVMNWRLALVAFAVLPLIAWVTNWFRRNVRESYRRIRGLIARVNAFLQEHLTGMSVVQLFNQEGRTFRRFDAVNREHREGLRALCLRFAGADVEAPLLVGVDPHGFDVRRRFDVIRVPVDPPMQTATEVREAFTRMLEEAT